MALSLRSQRTTLIILIEFFYNSSFPVKSWQDPTSIDREEQNKKVVLTRD